MNILHKLLYALLQQDFNTLSNTNYTWIIYSILFIIIFLENGLIPTAFLPGDSLLILVGILVTKKIIKIPSIILTLTMATILGCWLGYINGKFFSNTKIIKLWISNIPKKTYNKTNKLFNKYGLSAMIISKFIAFIRTLLPIIIGMSQIKYKKFQIYNVISSFIWVITLIIVGSLLSNMPIFLIYKKKIILFLTILPILIFIIGLIILIYTIIKKKIFNSLKIKKLLQKNIFKNFYSLYYKK
ncbi:DedA family protein [Candidatus Purcelliella pentastirinorum]|uniref:DedA family protein n=1 Tax=Candidatus Purcelliella pentastirinorum TaxID=472834 RepID=UPI002368036D|nr:DedA family protein [Candidatus Purcelliella pentastirinorum]WDI78780.1 DedA family protein [Candidatus Purcelliella pentastirinorum]WDR79914.1 DedA family protein [Candidatus Purcelliella pentastirinorum]